MGKIICNEHLGNDMFLMKIEGDFKGDMGQFYMVRGWDKYPLLSRPLSIHDIDDNSISFLYRVLGEGTEIFSKLKSGEDITLHGPYGNGYPKVSGRIALVGGGLGTAPLLLTAKKLREEENIETIDIYIGFREKVILEKEFKEYGDNVIFNIGGYITDDLDSSKYDYILTCGPEMMMEKIVDSTRDKDTTVYVSIEERMACGVGACLVCTCRTEKGNKKTCKDGPVFLGEDVFYEKL